MFNQKNKNGYYSVEELKALSLKSFGDNLYISKKVSIYGAEKVSIGSFVRIDDFCVLSGKISIGNLVHIGSHGSLLAGDIGITIEDCVNISQGVRIYCASDDYSGESMTSPLIPEEYKRVYYAPINIKRHSIIGSGSTILPGVTLAEGTAIGAMSMIKSGTKPWNIYAGIPAKLIKERSRNLLELEKKFLDKNGSI